MFNAFRNCSKQKDMNDVDGLYRLTSMQQNTLASTSFAWRSVMPTKVCKPVKMGTGKMLLHWVKGCFWCVCIKTLLFVIVYQVPYIYIYIMLGYTIDGLIFQNTCLFSVLFLSVNILISVFVPAAPSTCQILLFTHVYTLSNRCGVYLKTI